MNKDEKIRLFKAYLTGEITREQLDFLIQYGTIITPIQWVNMGLKECEIENKRRELVHLVFQIPKIETNWT